MIDLLGILPYYIEIALHQDTVCRYYPQELTSNLMGMYFSQYYSDSLSSEHLGSFEFFAHSVIIVCYYCEYIHSRAVQQRADLELRTIEVMYLSFRRSQHALLALAFFVVMVLVVFSTLLCVRTSITVGSRLTHVFSGILPNVALGMSR